MDKNKIISACYVIPGWMWPQELDWLYHAFENSQKHLEVGVFCGKSLLASAGGMRKPCQITAVDNFSSETINRTWTEKVLSATADIITDDLSHYFRLIPEDTVTAFNQLKTNGEVFDSVFIDACHHYAECKADIEMYSSLVRSGGIIAGHDFWAADPGVMEAVAETGPYANPSGTRIWVRRIP